MAVFKSGESACTSPAAEQTGAKLTITPQVCSMIKRNKGHLVLEFIVVANLNYTNPSYPLFLPGLPGLCNH